MKDSPAIGFVLNLVAGASLLLLQAWSDHPRLAWAIVIGAALWSVVAGIWFVRCPDRNTIDDDASYHIVYLHAARTVLAVVCLAGDANSRLCTISIIGIAILTGCLSAFYRKHSVNRPITIEKVSAAWWRNVGRVLAVAALAFIAVLGMSSYPRGETPLPVNTEPPSVFDIDLDQSPFDLDTVPGPPATPVPTTAPVTGPSAEATAASESRKYEEVCTGAPAPGEGSDLEADTTFRAQWRFYTVGADVAGCATTEMKCTHSVRDSDVCVQEFQRSDVPEGEQISHLVVSEDCDSAALILPPAAQHFDARHDAACPLTRVGPTASYQLIFSDRSVTIVVSPDRKRYWALHDALAMSWFWRVEASAFTTPVHDPLTIDTTSEWWTFYNASGDAEFGITSIRDGTIAIFDGSENVFRPRDIMSQDYLDRVIQGED